MIFSARDIKTEELRQRYMELLQRVDVYPTKSNWQYISESGMRGLCRLLYGKYLTALTIDDSDRDTLHDVAVEEFPRYLASVDFQEAIDTIYDDVDTDTGAAVKLIRECGLFDARRLLMLLSQNHMRLVLNVIDVYRREYDETELVAMKRLASALDELPELGRIESRQGIFGRQARYICPAGHTNPADSIYCSHCGLDICGVSEEDRTNIELFKKRMQALEYLVEETSES